jgi:hypothetical protein
MKIWICASIPNTTEIDIVGGYIGSYQEKFDPKTHLNLVGNISEADMVIVPHDAKYFSKNTTYLQYLKDLAVKKPLLISNRGDFPVRIAITNATILRVGIEPNEKVSNAIIIPYNIKSLAHLPLKNYASNPTIGFIGLVPKLSLGRTFKSFKKSPRHPMLANGAVVRRLALQELRKTSLHQEILIRESYGGISRLVSNSEKKRDEYVNNIADSDFVLCPRGDSNASLRFYETLSAGRIPLIPDTKIKLPYLENLNLRDAMLIFDIFSQNLEIEILDFWSRLDSIKYQEIQERIRFIYNNYYKFDVFLKNLLNVDIQNLSKYTSS